MILTNRELEVAECVASDLSEKMIAAKLFISPGTVHKHTANIRKKWNVKTSVGIAVKYVQGLEFPKKFVLASLFLIIQAVIICNNEDIQFRKPVKTAKKINKTKSKRKYV